MRTFSEILDTILDCDIVENIGQIEKKDLRLLDKAVKMGAISKGKGGVFPAIKTVYAPVGFDFIKHRQAVVNLVKDSVNGVISGIDYINHKWNYKDFIQK